MIHFNNDYSEGAHPRVMELLNKTNMEQTIGYGEDHYCQKATQIIKDLCGRQDVDVHFLVGGTQTNLTVISAALRPHQGAIAAETGHINVHESGAIEATGHKVLALSSADGKLTAENILRAYKEHIDDPTHEHMVQPKLVYISNPTELGTIYSKAQLTAISETCRQCGLYLYIDGARLGYALACEQNDLDLSTIASLCDAFYIGGTKVGLLFGEALLIMNQSLKEDFRYLIKQKGGLLAKGRLLGLQFMALLEDGLYFDISMNADKMAMKIKNACRAKDYPFLTESPTNQQFPILPNDVIDKLQQGFVFEKSAKIDEGHSVVRFCTSWATQDEDVEALAHAIANV